ncbi:TlpA disulfide reductase family protein [Aeribacillus sp. FSL W8-0870]|uniref:peroxiredoxin family protein n=1 Tax=Aeribacillus TaxID=1055323 RepID=UPI0030D5BACC
MKKSIQIFLFSIFFLLIGFTIYSQLFSNQNDEKRASGQTEQKEYPDIGYLAPSFSLKGLDGKTHELKDYLDKPVVLNFWASWCPPCIEEAPNFVKLHNEYGKNVHILTVNLTSIDDLQAAKIFAEEFGFVFPVLLDEDGSVAKRYHIKPIPATFFINQEGTIVDGAYGGLTWSDLESRTKELIQTDSSA